MAKRSINRRSSIINRSSVGSGRLNSDSSILGEEQSRWWNNLSENNMSQHLNLRNINETSRYLDSDSQINNSTTDPEWWKALEEIETETLKHNVVAQHKDFNEAAASKNTAVFSSSDSDSEQARKQVLKRKVKLRTKPVRDKSNAFLKVLKSPNVIDNLVKIVDDIKSTKTNAETANENMPSSSILNPKDTSTSSTDHSVVTHNVKKKKINPFLMRFKDKRHNLFAEALKGDSISSNEILVNNEVNDDEMIKNQTPHSVMLTDKLITEKLQKSQQDSETLVERRRNKSKSYSAESIHVEQDALKKNVTNVEKLNDSATNAKSKLNILNSSKRSRSKNRSTTDITNTTNRSVSSNMDELRLSISNTSHSSNILHKSNPVKNLLVSQDKLQTPTKRVSKVFMTQNKNQSVQRTSKSSTEKSISTDYDSEETILNEVAHDRKEVRTEYDSKETIVKDVEPTQKEVQRDYDSDETIVQKQISPDRKEIQTDYDSEEIMEQAVLSHINEVQVDRNSEKGIKEVTQRNTKEIEVNRNSEEGMKEVTQRNMKEIEVNRNSEETVEKETGRNANEVERNLEEAVEDEIQRNTEEVQMNYDLEKAVEMETRHNTKEAQMDYSLGEAVEEEMLPNTKKLKTKDKSISEGHEKQVINSSKEQPLSSASRASVSKNHERNVNTKQLTNQKMIHEYFDKIPKLGQEKNQMLNKININSKGKRKHQLDTLEIIQKIKQKWKNESEIKSNARRKQIDPAYLVNGKVYKPPRLPRPKYWATDRLYKYLWKKMEPKFKLETRVRSEKLIQHLAHLESVARKSKVYSDYKRLLHSVMKEMAQLGIITTYNDFYDFCHDFMPYEFRAKVVPMILPGNVQNIPYNPQLLNKSLLEE